MNEKIKLELSRLVEKIVGSIKVNQIILFTVIFIFGMISCASEKETEIVVEKYIVEVVREIPHSTESFTQGLLYHQGKLYESTGLVGKSSLQRLDAETGEVEKYIPVEEVFAEGLTLFNDKLYQLTWRDGKAFVYDKESFDLLETFSYETEGWGLTNDGKGLIMSDGSNHLYYREPKNFLVERKISITLEGEPISLLNELEYVEGFVYANVYRSHLIVKISPEIGAVVAVIDASLLGPLLPYHPNIDVLNGIAYNPETKTFYLTGKNWGKIFEVKFVRTFE